MRLIAYAAEIEHEGDLEHFREAIVEMGGRNLADYVVCYGDEDAAICFDVDMDVNEAEAALEEAGVCIIQVGVASRWEGAR